MPAQADQDHRSHKGVGSNHPNLFPFPALRRVNHRHPARPMPCRALTAAQLREFIEALE